MPNYRHNRDPLEKYLHMKLKTATILNLCGFVEDPVTKQWIEAQSEIEVIRKSEYVYVSKIDYFRHCLIVRRFFKSRSGNTKNQKGKNS